MHGVAAPLIFIAEISIADALIRGASEKARGRRRELNLLWCIPIVLRQFLGPDCRDEERSHVQVEFPKLPNPLRRTCAQIPLKVGVLDSPRV